MADDDDLLTARDSYARGDWRTAYTHFERVSQTAELVTDDLSAFGMAAWRLGYGRQSIQISEQAFNRLIAEHSTHSAAMKAVEVALQWFNGGDLTITRIWLSRARRLLEESPDDATLAYLLYVDSLLCIYERQYDAGSVRAEELRQLTGRLDQPAFRALGYAASGLAKIPFGRTNEAFADLDEAMMPVLADQVPVDWAGDIYCAVIHECYRLGDLNRMKSWTMAMEKWCQNPMVASSWYGTTCEIHKWQVLSATSNYRDLEAHLTRALAAVEDFHAPTAGEGQYELGELRRRRGDIRGAREAFAKAEEIGWDPQPGAALVRCQLGEEAAAANDLRMQMDAEMDEIGRIRLLPAAVEIALTRNRIEEADQLCRRLEDGAEKFDSPGFRVWALHARGAVLVRQEKPAEALPVLQEAFRRYRATQRRYEMAQVYEWVAEAHRTLNDHDSSASAAETAETIYDEIGAVSPRRSPTNKELPGGLTKREAEVLIGLATGASNRDLAKQLFISEKTVGRHLANIYVKLGVTSRTAAAAWAHEHKMLPHC